MTDPRSLFIVFIAVQLSLILALSLNISAYTNYRPACCCCLEFDPYNRDDELFVLDYLKDNARSYHVSSTKTQVTNCCPAKRCCLASILAFCDNMFISCRFGVFYMNSSINLTAELLCLLFGVYHLLVSTYTLFLLKPAV